MAPSAILARTESARRRLQQALDGERTAKQRNFLGQFATPAPIAQEMVQVALSHLSERTIQLLEPSIGSGALFSALIGEVESGRLESALGFEVDDRFASAARELWKNTKLHVETADFATAKPPATAPDQANLVLANPPYVRHHHIGRVRKLRLQERVKRATGLKPSGLAGLYLYFTLLAHPWMQEGGVGVWLVPSEWMDVNYGAALREYLCTSVTLLRVHKFDARDVQFGDALVSSSIVVFRKALPLAGAQCEFTTGSHLSTPERTMNARIQDLRRSPKWSQFFTDRSQRRSDQKTIIRLGDLFDIKRGVATGGNRFFVRPRDEFAALGISQQFLRPILPSSRHIAASVIERIKGGYPALAPRLALLDCRLSEKVVRRDHPALWKYLNSELGKVIREGYLSRNRDPWYLQETRPTPPILATYMGRGRKGAKPFRFFWNRSEAIATNVYLLLIPKDPLKAALNKDPALAGRIVASLNQIDPAELIAQGRVYGGGLHKLEPRELAQLSVPCLSDVLGRV